ncbi:hypothetical protein J6590_050138 [Homalodisca vitripennis]|nr:hypothetical protein J6590_050138 [Homalodisca vitripennis]
MTIITELVNFPCLETIKSFSPRTTNTTNLVLPRVDVIGTRGSQGWPPTTSARLERLTQRVQQLMNKQEPQRSDKCSQPRRAAPPGKLFKPGSEINKHRARDRLGAAHGRLESLAVRKASIVTVISVGDVDMHTPVKDTPELCVICSEIPAPPGSSLCCLRHFIEMSTEGSTGCICCTRNTNSVVYMYSVQYTSECISRVSWCERAKQYRLVDSSGCVHGDIAAPRPAWPATPSMPQSCLFKTRQDVRNPPLPDVCFPDLFALKEILNLLHWRFLTVPLSLFSFRGRLGSMGRLRSNLDVAIVAHPQTGRAEPWQSHADSQAPSSELRACSSLFVQYTLSFTLYPDSPFILPVKFTVSRKYERKQRVTHGINGCQWDAAESSLDQEVL